MARRSPSREAFCANARSDSDSHVKQRSRIGEFLRPVVSSALGLRLPFLFSLQRGSGAPFSATYRWHLWRCRAPCDRHARLPALHWRRFSSRAALPGNRTDELSLRPDPGGLTCPAFHAVHVQPSKAAPSCDGAGGDPRRPEAPVCVRTGTPGATLCSAK
jgi:hypothetical protein